MKAILIPDRTPIDIHPRKLLYLVKRSDWFLQVERYPRVTQGYCLIKMRFGRAGDDCSIGIGIASYCVSPIGKHPIIVSHAKGRYRIGTDNDSIWPQRSQVTCVTTANRAKAKD